jgi:cell division topological specificity factor
MFDFLSKFFGPKGSSETAKERLRLVLLSDHIQLAPEVVESLKRDLIAVISKYVEVDEGSCEVNFEHQDRQIAMLANIPILSLKAQPAEPPPPPPAAAPDPVPEPSATTASAASHAHAAAPKTRRQRRRRTATTKPATESPG